MKKFFRRLAALVVTAYAKVIFKQAMTAADERYKDQKEMIYVIADPTDSKRLLVLDRDYFRTIKRRLHIPSGALTAADMKETCFYHTANRAGKDALSQEDLDTRRQAFILQLLQRAQLA